MKVGNVFSSMPFTLEFSGTVEGNAVKLGMFGNARSPASAADRAVAGLHGRGA